jgi:hypothetical protein
MGKQVTIKHVVRHLDGESAYTYVFEVVGDLDKPDALKLVEGPLPQHLVPRDVYRRAIKLAAKDA